MFSGHLILLLWLIMGKNKKNLITDFHLNFSLSLVYILLFRFLKQNKHEENEK